MRWLILSALLLGLVATAGARDNTATRPGESLAPPPPSLKRVDQAYLIAAVRETITAASVHTRPALPSYVPPAVRDLRCPAFVTLRDEGMLLAIGQADSMPVLAAVVAAAEDAVHTARSKTKPITHERARTCSIEIELPGPSLPAGTGAEHPEDLAARYEPGLEGIGARVGLKEVYIRPSQLISLEPQCLREGETSYRCNRYQEAIESLLGAIGIDTACEDRDEGTSASSGAAAGAAIPFFRYRTLHFWQRSPGDRPVQLTAGMRLVTPDEVTPDTLDAVIERTARYIQFRQLPDGFFAYEFLPGRNRYNRDDQNWVRQAGIIWSAAVYARRTGDAGWRRCSDRAIDAMRAMLRPRAGVENALYVATPDGQNKLGATALFGLALLDAPEPDRYSDLVVGIGNALRSMQTPAGRFVVNFPPAAEQTENQDYSPGEALLLLARLYDQRRESRWRETLDRALPYYRTYYREAASPPFVVWQMQAFGRLARTTALTRYAEFVFEMADRLVTSQLRCDASDDPLAMYDGGLDVYARERAGISTAPYMEGLIEALRTARAFGDDARAQKYAAVLRRATRFLLQLRFKPEETFYVRSPADVVDGFRTSAIESTIRIDNNQHALFALLGVRSLLWSEESASRSASSHPTP